MKKVTLLLLSVWLVAGSNACFGFHRRGYPGVRGGYSRDYRYDGRYMDHSRSNIMREIRANERQIQRLERRLNNILGYNSRHDYRGSGRHGWEVQSLEREIRQLEERNRYLYSLIY